MECLICSYAIDIKEETPIQCSSDACNSSICQPCFEIFLKIQVEEKKGIPKCLNPLCKNGEYLYSKINKLPNFSKLITQYSTCLLHHYENIVSEAEEKKNEKDIKILFQKQILKKRKENIYTTFPSAIAFVVENAFPDDFKRIHKYNMKHLKKIKEKKEKENVTCPNVLCLNGMLDLDNNCLRCCKKYCPTCRIEITTSSLFHKCKKEDIDSLSFIENLIQCPSCKIPVEKSIGCNYITCSICKTNFDYITGEKTVYGNHEQHQPKVVLTSSLSLSSQIMNNNNDDEELSRMVKNFEDRCPKPFNFEIISNLLFKIRMESDKKQSLIIKLCRNYETYKIHTEKKRKFDSLLAELQKSYEEKKLTKELIIQVNYLY